MVAKTKNEFMTRTEAIPLMHSDITRRNVRGTTTYGGTFYADFDATASVYEVLEHFEKHGCVYVVTQNATIFRYYGVGKWSCTHNPSTIANNLINL